MEAVAAKKLVAEKLNNFGLDGNDFIDKMKECNGLIAGSFALQCLLNEEYPNSDIDVFIKGNDPHAFYNINNITGEEVISKKFTKFDTYLYEKYAINSDSDNTSKAAPPSEYLVNGIFKSQKYNIKNTTCTMGSEINIIQVNSNPKDFIMNAFDLSFCQSYFDGEFIYYHKDTLSKKGHICQIPECKDLTNYFRHKPMLSPYKSRMGFKNDLITRNVIERVKKYQKRGFDITNLEILYDDDY